MHIASFRKKPIMGILRGVEKEELEPLVEAAIAAGLETLEITMNTKDAPNLIKQVKKLAAKHLTLGAGTVLTLTSLKSALDSGASFIVTPVLIKEVMEYCLKNKIPIFPGALTPQEIYQAWEAGATMVKVFPAKFFGPEYFREIKGPFEKIELLACGGVRPDNLKDYFACGANAISFGASVFRKDWLAKKNFSAISASIKEYLAAWKGVSGEK